MNTEHLNSDTLDISSLWGRLSNGMNQPKPSRDYLYHLLELLQHELALDLVCIAVKTDLLTNQLNLSSAAKLFYAPESDSLPSHLEEADFLFRSSVPEMTFVNTRNKRSEFDSFMHWTGKARGVAALFASDQVSLLLYNKNKSASFHQDICQKLQPLLFQYLGFLTAQLRGDRAQWLEAFFEDNPHPSFVYSLKGRRILFVNQAMIREYGYEQEELLQMNIDDLQLIPLPAQSEAKALDTEQKMKGNRLAAANVTTRNTVFHEETVQWVQVNSLQEIKDQEHYYRKILESAHELIYHVDAEGKISHVNDGALHLTGYQVEELLEQPFTKLIREDYQTTAAAFYQQQLEGHLTEASLLELPLLSKSGQEVWIEQKVHLIDKEGQNRELAAISRDITERREAEEQIKLLKKWIDQFNDAIQVTDLDGNFVFTNRRAAERLGHANAELIGKKIQEVDPYNQWEDYFEEIKEKERLYVEGIALRPDGSPFPIEITAQYMTLGPRDYVIAFSRDISERKHTEELLLNKQNQLKSFVAAAPAAIAMFDKNMDVLAVSQKWYEEHNIKEKNIIGKNYYELFPKSSQHWREIHQRCLQGAIESCEEEQMILEDGTETWIKWEVRPWYNLESQVEGIVMFTEDITLRKNQEEELKIARDKAEEGSRAKQQFLANMSHEIRTPMNAILGMTRLLQKTNLTPRQATYQEAIKASADNLLVIINDILDISKIEAGKLNIESVGFDLNRLIHHLCNSIRHRAEHKDVGLFYDVDRRINDVLIGDPVRLNQILLNLVNNAIKFTEEGRVEIECILTEKTETTNEIEFRVIDTGIGIDEDKLSTIFESFSQGDDSVTRKYGGTGLGLSISKRLVELFGGELKVQSRRATGTTFYFTLSLKVGKESDLARKKEKKRKNVSLDGVRVLLAEDHDINQFLATTLLDEWGTTVEVVEDGRDVIQKLRKKKFDVVLMDIQMPVMGGIEATHIIRRQLKLNVPIIALTANALKGDSERYLNAGMDAYVSKPFEPVELFNTIAHVVNAQEMDEEMSTLSDQSLNQPHSYPEELSFNPNDMPNSNMTLYDYSKIQKMVNGDEAMVKKMITMFVERTPSILQELQQNFESGDYIGVSKKAHMLKASISLMGIDTLYENIRMIEKFAKENTKISELPKLIEELHQVCTQAIHQMKAKL